MRTLVSATSWSISALQPGSYASETDAAGNITRYNTSDGTSTGSFNNPSLWGSATNLFDGIQFVSGYQLLSFNINCPCRIISTEFYRPVKDQNR
ncbi:MAG: hypothetical protein VYC39_07735 [Myxococcota bacterium]|nr:hypothetical protein [Myxococcota bacterium]